MPVPGWYPDPKDARKARYWDGGDWTDETFVPPSSSRGGTHPSRPAKESPSARRRLLAIVLAIGVLAAASAAVLITPSDAKDETIVPDRRPDSRGAKQDPGLAGSSQAVPPQGSPVGTLCAIVRAELKDWTATPPLLAATPTTLLAPFTSFSDAVGQAPDTCTGRLSRGGPELDLLVVGTEAPESAEFVVAAASTALRPADDSAVRVLEGGRAQRVNDTTTAWVSAGSWVIVASSPADSEALEAINRLSRVFSGSATTSQVPADS